MNHKQYAEKMPCQVSCSMQLYSWPSASGPGSNYLVRGGVCPNDFGSTLLGLVFKNDGWCCTAGKGSKNVRSGFQS